MGSDMDDEEDLTAWEREKLIWRREAGALLRALESWLPSTELDWASVAVALGSVFYFCMLTGSFAYLWRPVIERIWWG